ncbi:hypothetical protein PTKIN_Ptkin01aG0128000 [Pterospermum kingtungense]
MEPLVTIGLRLLQYRVYSHCSSNIGGKAPFLFQNTQEGLFRAYFSRNHSFLSASSAVTNHSQVAWKRLSHRCSASGCTFPHISRIAQAVSLALSHSHLIVPGKCGLRLCNVHLKPAGPAFIKWGQWAATRPDLFPGDPCTKLSELHSKAPEHSFAYTKKTIERAFEEHVASGSIAQVHRASLRFRYPGKQVKPMAVAVDNFIHADMHPGNILVRVSQSKASRKRLFKSKPHVIFLDEVEEAFMFWGSPEGDLVHPAECMQQLLEKVRCHKVNIDGNVCTVMVTTLVLEGWQRKLDPGYDVMQTLQTQLLRKADLANSLSYTIDVLMAP